jgi:hypothetical protein
VLPATLQAPRRARKVNPLLLVAALPALAQLVFCEPARLGWRPTALLAGLTVFAWLVAVAGMALDLPLVSALAPGVMYAGALACRVLDSEGRLR